MVTACTSGMLLYRVIINTCIEMFRGSQTRSDATSTNLCFSMTPCTHSQFRVWNPRWLLWPLNGGCSLHFFSSLVNLVGMHHPRMALINNNQIIRSICPSMKIVLAWFQQLNFDFSSFFQFHSDKSSTYQLLGIINDNNLNHSVVC